MSRSNPNRKPLPMAVRCAVTVTVALSFLALVVAAWRGAAIPWQAFLFATWLTGKALSLANGHRADDPPPWTRFLDRCAQLWPSRMPAPTAPPEEEETDEEGGPEA